MSSRLRVIEHVLKRKQHVQDNTRVTSQSADVTSCVDRHHRHRHQHLLTPGSLAVTRIQNPDCSQNQVWLVYRAC